MVGRGQVLLECLEARLFAPAPASTAPTGLGRVLGRVSELATGEAPPAQAPDAARFWAVRTT
jgi:hypothetical protein